MESLPIELRRNILRFIELPSLKSFRLTSKAWAALGEEYLILPEFFTLPQRPDIERLLAISQHTKFRHRVQELHMNHGEVNEYHARHNTYFLQYTMDPENRLEQQTLMWDAYATIKPKKDYYLPYACEEKSLTSAFAGLPNLKCISVSLMTCPFQEDDHPDLLKKVWTFPTTRLLPRVATTERFTNILRAVAVNHKSIRLQSLAHDRLPFEFFAQKSSIIGHFSTTFGSLTRLNLALDYSDMPNNMHQVQAFQNLSHCLKSARSLKQLELAIQGRRKIDINQLLSSLSEDGYVCSSLEQVKLQGMVTTETALGDFLSKQPRLRKVQLGGIGVRQRHQRPGGGIHLMEGTFQGLFARIEHEMKLEYCKVQGDLKGLESGECWLLEVLEDASNLGEYVVD